ncbi:hypothetical protein BW39_06018 [Delftia sp. RIT313]|nr:hypothetical protein BW39_06018 [Delftia sp. RIT313]
MRQRRRQLQPVLGRAVDGVGAPCMVGLQLQHGLLTAQLLHPVAQLALALARLHPIALPGRIVAVLHGQEAQSGGPGLQMGTVQGGEFLDQDLHGAPVGHDVVHGDHQQMPVLPLAHQGHAHQRPRLQVERLLADLPHPCPGLRIAGRFTIP